MEDKRQDVLRIQFNFANFDKQLVSKNFDVGLIVSDLITKNLTEAQNLELRELVEKVNDYLVLGLVLEAKNRFESGEIYGN